MLDETKFDEALLELGKALEDQGWVPEIPLGRTLSDDNADPKEKRRILAVIFLAAHRAKLHFILCYESKVRDSVKITGDVVAHVAAHLSGLSWLEAAFVAPVASALCAAGLDSFCEAAPRDDAHK